MRASTFGPSTGVRECTSWTVIPDRLFPTYLGYDAASGGVLFGGFSSWIDKRQGGTGETSLTSDGQLMLDYGASVGSWRSYSDLSDAEGRAFLADLFASLDRFWGGIEPREFGPV